MDWSVKIMNQEGGVGVDTKTGYALIKNILEI